MKKTITLSIFAALLLINIGAKAQVPHWQWAVGSSGITSQIITELVTDKNGNAIVAGNYIGDMTIDSITISMHANNFPTALDFTKYDLHISKFNENGDLQWVVYPTGIDTNQFSQVWDLTIDPSGNTIAWLNLNQMTPSAAIVFGTDTIYTRSSMVKFDNNGNVVWHSDFARDEYGPNLATDNSGNIYLTATLGAGELTRTYDTVTVTNPHPIGNQEAAIVKFNSEGRALWAITAGGNNEDQIFSICTDSLGNLYVGGTFSSDTMFFNATTFLVNTAPASYFPADYFYAKYDSNGNLIWAKSIPWASAGFAYLPRFRFTVNPVGELFLSGMQSDTSFYVGPYNFADTGLFVAKMDVNGDAVWATYVGNPKYNSAVKNITVDESGYIYLSGFIGFADSVLMANTVLYNAGSLDAYIVVLNPNGGLLGAFREGGDDADDPFIGVNSNGSMYLGLTSSSNTLTFGKTVLTSANFPENHYYLAFTDPFVSGISNLAPGANFSIYPNPVSREINLQFKNSAAFPAAVNIINTLGETVYARTVADASDQELDVSGLAPGFYVLQIQNSTSASSAKFIKY